MAVAIRLSRQGAKKKPQYLIVAIDAQKKRDGAYLERLGRYLPKGKTVAEKVQCDWAAVEKWQKRGAQCSDTVAQLFKQARAAAV